MTTDNSQVGEIVAEQIEQLLTESVRCASALYFLGHALNTRNSNEAPLDEAESEGVAHLLLALQGSLGQTAVAAQKAADTITAIAVSAQMEM